MCDTITNANFVNFISFSFLATSDLYNSLATRFRLGLSTVHYIVTRTCHIIWHELSPIHLKEPTRQDWIEIEQKFETRWNFPNCIGALDGKHVVITAPCKSESLYFNYKGSFSLVLMALVDAYYGFIYVDIGDYGSNAGGSIFKNSAFGQGLIIGQLDVPKT